MYHPTPTPTPSYNASNLPPPQQPAITYAPHHQNTRHTYAQGAAPGQTEATQRNMDTRGREIHAPMPRQTDAQILRQRILHGARQDVRVQISLDDQRYAMSHAHRARAETPRDPETSMQMGTNQQAQEHQYYEQRKPTIVNKAQASRDKAAKFLDKFASRIGGKR